jgi:hypothetical protein
MRPFELACRKVRLILRENGRALSRREIEYLARLPTRRTQRILGRLREQGYVTPWSLGFPPTYHTNERRITPRPSRPEVPLHIALRLRHCWGVSAHAAHATGYVPSSRFVREEKSRH